VIGKTALGLSKMKSVRFARTLSFCEFLCEPVKTSELTREAYKPFLEFGDEPSCRNSGLLNSLGKQGL
jgi:hypothetical protein